MLTNKVIFDAIVIGGSFAGLSGAMHLARTGRNICVIDGGQPRNRFARTSHGFFGQDGMPPHQMIAEARAKFQTYPNVIFRDSLATTAQKEADFFSVTLTEGEVLYGKKLLLAYGVSDVLPEFAGLQERWGKSVLHCPYCHGYEIRGQNLGILSTTPESAHQALLVSDWGSTTLFLNGQPQPDEATLAKLAKRNVTIEATPLSKLEGTTPDLTGVHLTDGRFIPIRAMFTASRTKLNSDIAEQLGCVLDDGMFGKIIRVDSSKQTTISGVFAAGDTTQVMNATMASADGVMAGAHLHRSLIFEPLET